MSVRVLVLVILGVHLSFLSSGSFAQENISFANIYHMESESLKETRGFSVYLPPSYQSEDEKTYPVMYFLDGDKSKLLGISGVVEALSGGFQVSCRLMLKVTPPDLYFFPRLVFRG
jgi:hypothetical protein